MRYVLLWIGLILLGAGCSLFESGTKSDDTSQQPPPAQTELYRITSVSLT
ncbi:MAG: hypothetical protein N2561_03815 [Bacteroidetes bacterium]|nr:hypothetical protein [Rhodothermia bacterium]MCS7154316.1 hypothetical protein [Bacteroidota bacterium]MCX7906648.1 hypothetical protein [Bacteroidota bacterium]MDW8137072.1 hypothetical protein [Bacteroidota bacterium]MDW8285057.1 hypothetical protein [Bacteroidota bacterium]